MTAVRIIVTTGEQHDVPISLLHTGDGLAKFRKEQRQTGADAFRMLTQQAGVAPAFFAATEHGTERTLREIIRSAGTAQVSARRTACSRRERGAAMPLTARIVDLSALLHGALGSANIDTVTDVIVTTDVIRLENAIFITSSPAP